MCQSLPVGKHFSCIYTEDTSPYVRTAENAFRSELPDDISMQISSIANSKPQCYLFDIPNEVNQTGIENIIRILLFSLHDENAMLQ